MRFLLLMLLVGTLTPILLIRAGLYIRWLDSQYQKELQANLELARAAGLAFDAYISDVARQLTAIGSAIISLKSLAPQELTQFLVRSVAEYPPVRAFHWVDLNGTVIASSSDRLLGLNIKDRPYFQQSLQTDSWVVSDLLESRADGALILTVSRSIHDSTGQLHGVAVAAIDADHLARMILDIERSPGSMLDIIDRQGRIVAAHPEMNIAWSQRLIRDDDLLAEALAGRSAVGTRHINLLGGKWAIARVPIRQTGFVASAGRSVDAIVAPLRYDIITTCLISLPVIAGAVVVALLICRRINRGLEGLQAHAEALAAGNLDHRAEVTGITELQALAQAFNRSAEYRKRAESAIRQSEERFRYATEAMAGFIYDIDIPSGTIRHSSGIVDVLGLEPDEVVPINWPREFLHPDDRIVFEQTLQGILDGTIDSFDCEFRVRHRDGHTVWLADRGQIIRDSTGRAVRVVGGVADISERKLAEEALRDSEARLYALIESLPFDCWACDQTGRYTLVNSVCRRRWGDLRGKRPEETDAPPNILALWTSNNRRALAGEEVHGEVEYAIDGEHMTFFNVIAPIRDGPEIRGLVGVNIDITDRKRAEQQLKELNDTLEHRIAERTAEAEHRARQLLAMATELARAEERERRRLARILHDDLQQLLAAAKFHASVLDGQLESADLRERLWMLMDLVDQSIKVSRTLTTELSPPVLYDAGLVPAITWLARWMETQHGLAVTVDASEDADPIPEQIRVFLFQAIRELLFNVIKHAHVDHADVRIDRWDSRIRIQVHDQGAGFTTSESTSASAGRQDTKDADQIGRFGLFSIRERIEWIGGHMEIESAPGAGTRITLWAPAEMPSQTPGQVSTIE